MALAAPGFVVSDAAPAPWVLVFDGDSVSQGFGVADGDRPSDQIARLIAEPVRIVNVAVSGRPVSVSLAEFGRSVAPHHDPEARRNVIAFHGGDNDIAAGDDAVRAYDSLCRYVAAAHAQGWKVVVSTELGRPDWDAAMQAELAEYRRLELANRAGADAVIDYASAPGMSDGADRERSGLFGPDRIHPSARGYGLLAEMLRDGMATLTKPGSTDRPEKDDGCTGGTATTQ